MENNNKTPQTPFDDLMTPSYLHFIKILFPFLPSQNRKEVAIIVKCMELTNVISYFKDKPTIQMQSQTKSHTPEEMLTEIKPYLSAQELSQVDQLSNMFQMMQLFQTMQKAEPENSQAELLKSMLSPEQAAQFQMYETMFGQELNSETQFRKDTFNERMDK